MSNNLAMLKRDTVDVVTSRIRSLIESRELQLPPDYSAENALKAAWLTLQSVTDKNRKPALTVCTKDSIANSLLDMVVQALNPVKKQCYFIVYGDKLNCQRSYFGDMALTKRVLPKSEIYYGVVYEGDEFEYQIDRGKRRITKHNQKVENVKPDKIVATYCIIEPGDDQPAHTEIMTWAQIQQSWKKSPQYKTDGSGTPHHEFPDQMALRTVIRRACKTVINSSTDDYLLLHHMNRSDDYVEDAMDAEVAEHANAETIDIEAEEVTAEPETAQEATEEGAEEAAGSENDTGTQTELGPGF